MFENPGGATTPLAPHCRRPCIQCRSRVPRVGGQKYFFSLITTTQSYIFDVYYLAQRLPERNLYENRQTNGYKNYALRKIVHCEFKIALCAKSEKNCYL